MNFKSSTDVMDMLLLTDAIRGMNSKLDVSARIWYMPYARQDRRCVRGESHSLRVMAQLINSCNFSRVEVWDPHSMVTEALINNIHVVPQHELFDFVMGPDLSKQVVLLSPDAGALKKIYECADGRRVVCAHKTRDASTGKLSGCNIALDDLPLLREEVWVVDDICDGGGTFIQLIEHVKQQLPACKLNFNLYVTHGIFSKGKQCLLDAGYVQVVAANDWTTSCN